MSRKVAAHRLANQEGVKQSGIASYMPADPEGNRIDQVKASFIRLVESRALHLPLPGSGRTIVRWNYLAEVASDDLCVARLCEAHLDAGAILAELHGPVPPRRSRWGVWAAHPAQPSLFAHRVGDEWQLNGTKPFCSGARVCTHALVSADANDGYRLFAVELSNGISPRKGTWPAVGMAASDSLTVDFDQVAAIGVGGSNDYLHRPGFWYGASAVAACWYGGAVGLARSLVKAHFDRPLGPHALAHLGAVDAALHSFANNMRDHAEEVDQDPLDKIGAAEIRARQLRHQSELVAMDVMDRVRRALGARPLVHDARHAALAADLPVYLAQSHGESDLEILGKLVAERGTLS